MCVCGGGGGAAQRCGARGGMRGRATVLSINHAAQQIFILHYLLFNVWSFASINTFKTYDDTEKRI